MAYMTTREAAEKADVSMQRAQQFARTNGVKRERSKSGVATRFVWTEDDVQTLISRKGKFGPVYESTI